MSYVVCRAGMATVLPSGTHSKWPIEDRHHVNVPASNPISAEAANGRPFCLTMIPGGFRGHCGSVDGLLLCCFRHHRARRSMPTIAHTHATSLKGYLRAFPYTSHILPYLLHGLWHFEYSLVFYHACSCAGVFGKLILVKIIPTIPINTLHERSWTYQRNMIILINDQWKVFVLAGDCWSQTASCLK